VGAYVPVRVLRERRERIIAVPASCIVEGPDGTSAAFVVKGGALEVRKVARGLAAKGLVEIVEGVQAGEKVVQSTFYGWATLSQGLEVEVIP